MPDILIRGMEMPQSCDVCPFVHENDDLMHDDYRFLDCAFPNMGMFVTDFIASRHPDCPLGEVKAPHGRLIDADALMPDFEKATCEFRDGYTFQWLLEHAPTIVPAEGGGEDG